jgi:hypothetical protein
MWAPLLMSRALVADASAGPGMVPYPPQTSPKNEVSWGAGLGGGEQLQVPGGFAFSGWSRYGLTDRVEVFGGAWFTVPAAVGVHGGLRVSAGNPSDVDGVGVSAGLTVGGGGFFNVALPLEAGLQRGGTRVWLGAQPAIYPSVADADPAYVVEGFPADLTGHLGFEQQVEEDFFLQVTAGGGTSVTWFAMLGVTWSEW